MDLKLSEDQLMFQKMFADFCTNEIRPQGEQIDQSEEPPVDLLNEVGPFEWNVRELAKRAGVAERTVYRHFPDRQALVDGLYEHIDQRADWAGPHEIEHPTDFARVVGRSWRAYGEFERETRALVLMNLDPARTASRSRTNTTDIQAIIRAAYPDIDDDDVVGVAAIFNLLASSRTWLRLRDGHGMTSDDALRYIGWAADLLVADLESGNRDFSGRAD